jgi:hypothetical protein
MILRIVRFVLIDFAMIAVLLIILLLNKNNLFNVNILISIYVFVAFCIFELVLILFYFLSIIFSFYRIIFHVLLYSLFFIYVNVIAIQDNLELEVFDVGYCVIIVLSSLFIVFIYHQVLSKNWNR